jgi:hypothetical protein
MADKFTAEQQALIAALIADNAVLKAQVEAAKVKAQAPRKLSFKVGEKGGVSVYGLSARFPITLYKSQWERLLSDETVKSLKDFITAHPELKVKE